MSYRNNLISYLKMSCDTSYPLFTARGCKTDDTLESVLCQLFHFAQWNFVQNEIKFHFVFFFNLHTKTESEVGFQKLFKTRHFVEGVAAIAAL